MPSNLAAYLAKNYLTASTASNEPPKKKRKKSKGLTIADDDEDLSLSNAYGSNGRNAEEETQDGPTMYESKVRSAEFRKAKKSAWQSLPGPELESPNKNPEDDDDDADILLRTAQSDEARRLAEQEAENAPAIVTMDIDNDTPKMESGIRAGLQTAADTARLVALEEEEEAAERERERERTRSHKSSKKSKHKTPSSHSLEEDPSTALAQETIYRDASGRRIDISARRAEARREEAERARAAQQEKRDAMGEVQLREREARKAELEDAKFLTLGRGVEDEEYNDRLKGVQRWDDPMAGYMAEKRELSTEQREAGAEGKGDVEKKKKKKKEYMGSAAPNRYGIKPGWRWDGVDRGNGFEKEWFQARSRRSRNEALSYEWQMDE